MFNSFDPRAALWRELGDPAFAIVPSTKQWLKSYVYATPVGAEVFLQNFINVAIDARGNGNYNQIGRSARQGVISAAKRMGIPVR